MRDIVYLNGEFISCQQALIGIDDRGFNFADGVYEVIAIYNGKPYKMKEHFIRLIESASALEIQLPDYHQLMDYAEKLIAHNDLDPLSQIYVQVTRGIEPRKHLFSDDLKPNILMTLRELKQHPDDFFKKGCKAITIPDERWSRCNIKSISLLPNILGKKRAKRAGAFEAIQVRDGFITEGTSSNVFIIKNDQLLTPPATNYILNGITRQVLLEESIKLGISVKEKSICLNDLYTADEVFLSGTTTEVMPIVEIDGKVINDGKPGTYTMRLLEHYRSLLK